MLTLDYLAGLSLSDTKSSTFKVNNIDDKQIGIIGFDVESLTIKEGESATVTLVRKEGLDGELTANLVAEDITASATNYSLSSTQVVFHDGENTKTIEIKTR